jgi:hypothetical protein
VTPAGARPAGCRRQHRQEAAGAVLLGDVLVTTDDVDHAAGSNGAGRLGTGTTDDTPPSSTR